MKNKNNLNFAHYILTGSFLTLSLACALYFMSMKKTYEAANEQLIHSQNLVDTKFQKVIDTFNARNSFLISLSKNDKTNSIKQSIDQLTEALKTKPIDIDKIEKASSALNQKIYDEIISFNTTQKSVVFKSATQIRNLEQYDRYIDLARNDYSDWTFEYVQKKKKLTKNHIFKTKVGDIAHFKVDHLIRTELSASVQ